MENRPLTWREVLNKQKGNYIGGLETDYSGVERRMKERFPGNYIVEEYFNPAILNWDLRLVFDTPEDETWFMLKNE